MLAKYLGAIKKRGIVSSTDEQALFSSVKAEFSRKKKDTHARDTHTKAALNLYGLININEDGSFSVSPMGQEVIACFEENTNFSQEDFMALMLKVFVRMEITDEQFDRHIHIGFILLKLLSDPLVNYYITNHELAHLVMNSNFINDSQYEEIRDYVLNFRNSGVGISQYTSQTKATTFLATFVNNWNFLIDENIELSPKQIKQADKFFASYMSVDDTEDDNSTDDTEDDLEDDLEDNPEDNSEDNPENGSENGSIPDKELTASQKNAYRAFHTITKYRLNSLAAYIAHIYISLLEGINIKDYLSYFNSDNSYGAASLTADNLDIKQGDLSSIILYGPPGTGKTHKMQTKYISKFVEEDKFITTFHQSFSYEEFVEGLKPILDDADGDYSGDVKYIVERGIFRKACERAAQLAGYSTLAECISDSFENRHYKINKAKNEKKIVLLCIDEINRGNIASIFGDLISLIEENKRLGTKKETEMVVSLPYSQDKFGVPANILIVGTMNTADRSIQLLDSALRRRFRFEELMPNYSVITNPAAKKILQNINARIRCLLNKDNQIGHSYLMNAKTNKDIINALINKIIPLLEEYFYNETEKVRFVLNEIGKKENTFYKIDNEATKAYEAYLSDDMDDGELSFYELDRNIIKTDEEECGKYLQHLLNESE